LLQVLGSLLILNNTIGWGDLCKVESKHVIHNKDLETYLPINNEGEVFTDAKNSTSHSVPYDSEFDHVNKTLDETELDLDPGNKNPSEYNEGETPSTDTVQNEENMSERRTNKMIFCA